MGLMQQIKLYVIYPNYPVNVRPAPKARACLPENALRCLPVQMANQYGYEILCNEDFDVNWNGGPRYEDVTSESIAVMANSGRGFFSIHTNLIVRTPPGINTWVQGPVNFHQSGVHAVTALVETDWAISQLSMNYKIEKENTTVSFKKGDPFCTFFPVQRRFEENFILNLEPLGNDQKEFDLFMRQRESTIATEGRRNNQYRKGIYHNGEICPVDHQRRISDKLINKT